MTKFTFEMDQDTYEAYRKLCNALGLTMSSATLALVKQAVRDRGKSLLLQYENGFTPAEAAELKRRILEVKHDDLMHQI